MTMFLAPYTAIADLDGSPLDAGFLFFGEYGKDPESFPVEAFWDAEFTIPAAQPIRTRNGYPFRNGSPAKVHLKQPNHSIAIKNRNGAFILVDFTNKGWDITFTEQQRQINDLQEKTNLSIINYVNPRMFGATGTGDDTQAIKDCFNFMVANGASFYDYSESTYKFSSDITVEAPNKTINIQTNCKLVSDTSILRIRGTVEEIGTITTAANKGSISITSSISVNAGDVIAIHNTTNNSFFNNSFASRQYYKDGEFKTVELVSGDIVKFTTPLESSYAAAATNKIYKVNPVKLLINGLSVESNGVCAAILSLGYKSEIVNMNGYNLLNANNSSFAVQLERFYDSSLIGGEFIKKGIAATSGGATDYGLAISNCQDLNAMPRYAYGGRHGISVGGGPSIAAVPNRRVFIENAVIENDPSSDLQAADLHGNVANSHYKNCIIRGRISLSGYNTRSIQNQFYLKADETRPPVGLTEVIGGYIESIDDEVIEGGTCAYFMGWTTSINTGLMKEDATISIKNGSIKGNATLVGFLPIFNTSVNTRYVIDGFDIKGTVPATFNRVISYAAGSAALKPAYIQATRPNFPISDAVNPIFGDANLAGILKRVYPLSGSNANGSWTKMEDGTLICRQNIAITTPITTTVNGGFKSSDIPWTYPKPFIEKPGLDSMVFDNSSASIRGASAGSTAVQLYSFSTVSVASAGVNFDVKATGKYLY